MSVEDQRVLQKFVALITNRLVESGFKAAFSELKGSEELAGLPKHGSIKWVFFLYGSLLLRLPSSKSDADLGVALLNSETGKAVTLSKETKQKILIRLGEVISMQKPEMARMIEDVFEDKVMIFDSTKAGANIPCVSWKLVENKESYASGQRTASSDASSDASGRKEQTAFKVELCIHERPNAIVNSIATFRQLHEVGLRVLPKMLQETREKHHKEKQSLAGGRLDGGGLRVMSSSAFGLPVSSTSASAYFTRVVLAALVILRKYAHDAALSTGDQNTLLNNHFLLTAFVNFLSHQEQGSRTVRGAFEYPRPAAPATASPSSPSTHEVNLLYRILNDASEDAGRVVGAARTDDHGSSTENHKTVTFTNKLSISKTCDDEDGCCYLGSRCWSANGVTDERWFFVGNALLNMYLHDGEGGLPRLQRLVEDTLGGQAFLANRSPDYFETLSMHQILEEMQQRKVQAASTCFPTSASARSQVEEQLSQRVAVENSPFAVAYSLLSGKNSYFCESEGFKPIRRTVEKLQRQMAEGGFSNVATVVVSRIGKGGRTHPTNKIPKMNGDGYPTTTSLLQAQEQGTCTTATPKFTGILNPNEAVPIRRTEKSGYLLPVELAFPFVNDNEAKIFGIGGDEAAASSTSTADAVRLDQDALMLADSFLEVFEKELSTLVSSTHDDPASTPKPPVRVTDAAGDYREWVWSTSSPVAGIPKALALKEKLEKMRISIKEKIYNVELQK
ncbi:unnamed protein product [Amoebophrya sp. A25]|nr:unnamed protein product [Amoebophrya sp. A25]|eukprot:GSA25T00022765001.1